MQSSGRLYEGKDYDKDCKHNFGNSEKTLVYNDTWRLVDTRAKRCEICGFTLYAAKCGDEYYNACK